MSLADRFNQRLGAVERFRRQGDESSAHGELLEAVREYLNDRYPFRVASAKHGLSVSYNGYTLVAVDVVAHSGIKGSERLAEIPRTEITQALSRLVLSPAPARILVVRNLPVKDAVFHDLSDKLAGIEVWTTDDLVRLDLPLRG